MENKLLLNKLIVILFWNYEVKAGLVSFLYVCMFLGI